MTTEIGADMLRKAVDTVARRHNAYGPPDKNFANIARLWTAWLVSRYGEVATLKLDEVDVAVMNGLIKDARIIETPDHFDSWLDKAGYAACGLEVAVKKKASCRLGPFLPVEQVPESVRALHNPRCNKRFDLLRACNCAALSKEAGGV